MTLLAGVDIGTSTIKAVILDDGGQVLAAARVATPWSGHAERQHASADDITAAAEGALSDALDRVPGEVAALGITGLAESGVLTDAAGRACSTVLPWHDLRGEPELRQLQASVPQFGQLTGQFATVRLTAVKYRWLRGQRPRSATAGWRSVPEEVVARLGGDPAPELSQWSRTGFIDIASGGYCAAVADWAGLPWRDLPEPVVAGTPLGRVRTDHPVAALRGAALTVAGQDHVCAAYGAGVTDARRVFDSWGNGEALVRGCAGPPDVRAALAAGFSVSWGLHAGGRVLFRGLGTGLVLHQVLDRLGQQRRHHGELDAQLAALSLDLLSLDLLSLNLLRPDGLGPVGLSPDLLSPDLLGPDGLGPDLLGRGPELPALATDAEGSVSALKGAAGTEAAPGTAQPAAAVVWAAALDWAFARVADGVRDLAALSGAVEEVVGCGGWLRSAPVAARKAARVPGFTVHPAAEPAAIGAALISARTLATC